MISSSDLPALRPKMRTTVQSAGYRFEPDVGHWHLQQSSDVQDDRDALRGWEVGAQR